MPVVWLAAGVTLLIFAAALILTLGSPDGQAFTTPDGAVTVQFPGEPGENNVRDMLKWQVGTGEGRERRIYVLGVRRAGPPPTGRWASWQRTLARSLRERYVSSLVSGWQPCGEEPVMMGPHHGVQVEYCPDGRRGNDVGHVVARLFVVRNASIVALVSGAGVRPDDEDVQAFFASLRIDEEALERTMGGLVGPPARPPMFPPE